MKKIISILLAVLLTASLTTAAFAEGAYSDFENVGISILYSNEMDSMKGFFFPYSQGAISFNPRIYYMPVFYFAMPLDNYFAYMAKEDDELTEEEQATLRAAQGSLGFFLVSDADFETALAATGMDYDPANLDVRDVGTADGFHFFYILTPDEDYLASIGEEYAADYAFAQQYMLNALQTAKIYAPVDPLAGFIGKTFHFKTTDVYGTPVTSDEIFAANEITMINYWGTWCHFCVQELDELADIHTRLQDKGCGIIGILQDGDEADKVELAKGIMTEHGTNYPVLLPTEEMDDILGDVTSFPTSFFVDKSGTILCYPIRGAAVDQYEPTVLALLNSEKFTGDTTPAPLANDLRCYRVFVCDTDGSPVKGVTIQFCSDDACNLGKTDADGIARFDVDEGIEYSVHVLKVPSDYRQTTEEYKTLAVYSDVNITLEKAD